uniref:Uncharacterized protein n=1 Tax=Acrobeloides nanus TaxID=290746 RepID=A0A914C3H7_9BILA
MTCLRLLLLYLFSNLVDSSCPLNGIPSSDGTKCYHIFSNTLNYIEALNRTCNDIGGQLASICNGFDNAQLQGFV